MRSFDVVIVGAGIVGLASARELLMRHRSLRLAVLEKEAGIGLHQTSHNSGVIHSGIYYAPGSLKARLCVQGAEALYRYCVQREIPVERCGKVIVAVRPDEVPRLEALYQNGRANGVPDLALIGPERLRELEPHCRGLQALWSPTTGIVDFRRVAGAYAEDIAALGGEIWTGARVVGVSLGVEGVIIHSTAGEMVARHLVACAGLYADRLATQAGAVIHGTHIVPFRGDYWLLRPERHFLVRNLIYPVPDPDLPFLGVHLTRRIGGSTVWLGPNAVLALAREGYRRFSIRPADFADVLSHRGFWRMARRYWRTGVAELARDVSKTRFLRDLQHFVPELTEHDLLPGPSGVRAQAVRADGSLEHDFVVQVQDGRCIHVINAPSPAATSSLAIAQLVADAADDAFELGRRIAPKMPG